MIPNLIDRLEGEPNVSLDRRASLRGRNAPERTRLFRVESFQQSLEDASRNAPSAIVKEDGSILLMDSGGSGDVWVCTSGIPSDRQEASIELVREALYQMGACLVATSVLPDLPRE